ncbi:hypothetical protein K1X76_06560 [bacterium]|nr:hypothetical protein [bacterium]
MLINWKFARKMNKLKKRRGHFWLDRYKCIPVESDEYCLALMRYINRNPLRAKMITECGEWKWSGYHYYANGEPNDLITPHTCYLGLSRDPEKRKKEYTSFVNTTMNGEEDQKDPKMSQAQDLGSRWFNVHLKKLRENLMKK